MTNKIIENLVAELFENTPDSVVGVGFGYKTKNGLITEEKSIIFQVDKKLHKEDLNPDSILPTTINYSGETFTTDVVEVHATLLDCPSNFYRWENPATPPSNRNTTIPLKGGVSVSTSQLPNSVGTLGFLAVDNDTNSLVGVSNNHVLVRDAFINLEKNPLENFFWKDATGSQIFHPNEGGNYNIIGKIKKYKPIRSLPTYNRSDVALSTISQEFISLTESYKMEGLTGWTQPLEFATTAEIDNLLINKNSLFSTGRTTGAKGEGATKLIPFQYPTTISVNYNRQDIETLVYFERVITFVASASTTPAGKICEYPIFKGDSGSALIADINGTRKIVGLCFAGGVDEEKKFVYGYANRIDDVAQDINISAWTGQTVSFSNINSGNLQHIVPGMSSTEKLVIDGKTFWQIGYKFP